MDKVTAYKACPGAPLETNPVRAYAWKLEKISEKKISFSAALWILENPLEVKSIIDECDEEIHFGAKE